MNPINRFYLAFFLTAGVAHAQIQFDNLIYKGTGCPDGTVTSITSPDGSALSILFDQFIAEVPQYDGDNDNNQVTDARSRSPRRTNDPALSHKACALSFVASVPDGHKVESLEVSLNTRGLTAIDQGVIGSYSATISGYSGLATQNRAQVIERKAWQTRMGAIDQDWTLTPKVVIPIQSNCATTQQRTVKFNINNHINLEIQDGDLSKAGIVAVDSSDIVGSMKFKLITSACRVAPPAPTRPTRPTPPAPTRPPGRPTGR